MSDSAQVDVLVPALQEWAQWQAVLGPPPAPCQTGRKLSVWRVVTQLSARGLMSRGQPFLAARLARLAPRCMHIAGPDVGAAAVALLLGVSLATQGQPLDLQLALATVEEMGFPATLADVERQLRALEVVWGVSGCSGAALS